MVSVHDVLRGASLLLSLDGDRNSMLIRAADVEDVLSSHPQISHIDIRRHIHSGQMADMDGTVRIRQCAGHKRSVEFLFHYMIFIDISSLIVYTLPSSLLRRVRALLNSPIRVIIST